MQTKRISRLKIGTGLLKIFYASLVFDFLVILYFIIAKTISWPAVIILAITEFCVFWAGIILVYISSQQLGIKPRVLGLIFGFVPIANLIMLYKIIKICSGEIRLENVRMKRDMERISDQICDTKYPILLVHGVFFRDSQRLNYWGRIPADLKKNGARIYYGEHNSAAAVDNSAKELAKRVDEILEKTGCEKLNIIAHSKGGLDSRTLISDGYADKIASLTTINTPHRGCEFADYFLAKIPKETQSKIAEKYNAAATKLGDVDPDFISAVDDLTAFACRERNKHIKNAPGVYYQSVGSVLHQGTSGRFPLNLTYGIVKLFDGENDGLVGVDSFRWGEDYVLLRNAKTNRGISHADMIDLNRENIDGFDVREFYIKLVADLKERGF